MSDQKIVLITGASRGIGQAIALAMAEAGYRVIGTATSEKGAQSIQEALSAHGDGHQGIVLQLNDTSSIESALTHISDTIGMPDILVNNAGITRDNLFMRLKQDDLDAVIQTNLGAVMQLTQRCIKAMVKKRWGRVINIGSVVGSTGNPGQTNYAAAKAGLVGFAKSLAQEIASRNITVNTIAPGFIDTDMTQALNDTQKEAILTKVPMRRLGQGTDIAHTACFLASEKANYITGQTIHVNGGMYLT